MAFADNNYEQKRALYDILAQVFDTYKYGITSGGHTWNQPVQEIRGITMRFLGEGVMELTYHRYENTTVEGIHRIQLDNAGVRFLGEVAKALKKEFKEATGKALTLTKMSDKPFYVEKASQISAESSFLFGAGHGRPVGRYLIRASCVYDFNCEL